MKILLKPMFENEEEGEYYGLLSMRQPNQDALDGELRAYLNEIFPEPGRAIERVRGTNFYSVDVLNDAPDNIKTWYDTHLADALARGFVVDRDWEIFPKDERQPVDEGVTMYFDTLAETPVNMGFDFDTEEGRENVYRYTLRNDSLEGVLLPDLYAQGFDYTAMSFAKSKLMNSVFRKAFLQLVNFQYADLTGVDFQDADLRYAFFQGADLTEANFLNADLTGAGFTGSNWREAKNLIDNPTFRAPITPKLSTVSATVDLPIPFTLKKQIKAEREDRTKIVKPTVLEKPNRYNIGTSQSPIWREDEIDETDVTRFKTTRRGPRKRMVAERAVYSIKPAEYERVDPSIVTLDNEESDVGKMLNEDALFDDELVSLKEFFKGPGGFLFRVVQGDKFEDILVSANGYQPSTSKYLRNSTDLKLYTCNEPGSMNRAKINLNRPLIDIGKAIGLQATRIYVDYNRFVKTVLDDTRQYKCYILYKYKTSEKYKSLASYNAIYNPTGDPQVYVSNLHCNEGADMDGVIWSIKPIGNNLLTTQSSKKTKTIQNTKRRKTLKPRTVSKVLHRRTTGRALTAADETTAGGGTRRHKKRANKIKKNKNKTRKNYKK